MLNFKNSRVVKRIVWICLMASTVFAVTGCNWHFFKEGLYEETLTGTNRTLVIFLPPIHGEGLEYEKKGFIQAVRERGFEANLKILDVSPFLYLKSKIVDLLKTEVVDPAKVEGYDTIILFGISLGGHGALLYLTRHPEDVDGIVVFAPFLAGPMVVREIEKAGGLDTWKDCPFFSWDYACSLWLLLKDFTSDPEKRKRIILGYGTEDSFSSRNQLLAQTLPTENVFTISGGHDWVTWKGLWIRALDHFHVRCRPEGKGFCFIKEKKLSD